MKLVSGLMMLGLGLLLLFAPEMLSNPFAAIMVFMQRRFFAPPGFLRALRSFSPWRRLRHLQEPLERFAKHGENFLYHMGVGHDIADASYFRRRFVLEPDIFVGPSEPHHVDNGIGHVDHGGAKTMAVGGDVAVVAQYRFPQTIG